MVHAFDEFFDVAGDFPLAVRTCIQDVHVSSYLENSDVAHEIACALLAGLALECEMHGVTVDWRKEAL